MVTMPSSSSLDQQCLAPLASKYLVEDSDHLSAHCHKCFAKSLSRSIEKLGRLEGLGAVRHCQGERGPRGA